LRRERVRHSERARVAKPPLAAKRFAYHNADSPVELRSRAMKWVVSLSLGIGLLCGSAVAEPPTEAEIQAAIKQLGNERFAVREKATKFLWKAGPAAEKALREASGSPDPEVAKRVHTLIERIRFRIEPDTPPEIVALIQKYKTGTVEEQAAIVKDMIKLGSKSNVYLLRMLGGEDDKSRQRALLDQFAFDDWKILVPLMADGQDNLVEEMLELATDARIDSAIPHFAVFQYFTGRTDETIAKLRAGVLARGGPQLARKLAALYRLKGDWNGVAFAADRAESSDLVKLALMEQGKWGELLTRYTPTTQGGLSDINGLGLLAAYHRLAGNKAEFEKSLNRIVAYADGPKKDSQPFYAAKALMINERTQDAIDLLVKHEQWQQAAELLAVQGKYKEAIALSERAALAETQPSYSARMTHINLLQRLGEVARGAEWLDRLEKDMASVTTGSWMERKIELEYRLGRVEPAEKHLLELIEKDGANYLGHAFEATFPQMGERADTLWRLLRYQTPMSEPMTH
jgi:tetratricopeptide (TPR) repeat protein